MTNFRDGQNPLDHDFNRKVVELAHARGLKVYLVGGWLRDNLGGYSARRNHPVDFDYAIAGGAALEFAQSVAKLLEGHYVLLDPACDTARVVLPEGPTLDFAACVGGQIATDILRRDFTVNALAWDPQEPEKIIDLVGGLEDLKTRTIRAIDENNFQEDPLRLLRAFRFATAIGGTIEPATRAMIVRHAAKLPTVAAERISYELFATMECQRVFPVVSEMADTGILEAIFPELTDTRRVTRNAYHHLDLWHHTLELVDQAELQLPKMPPWAQGSYAQELSQGVSRLAATKVACLLHDIGKPETWEITDEGRHTFYGHDRLGAEMTGQIAERLRWAGAIEKFTVKLVRWHLRPGQLFHQGLPSQRAVHRFYRSMGNDVPELILLAFADFGATCGPGLEGAQRDEHANSLFELLEGFFVFKTEQQAMVALLDGNQIMQLLSIPPSPVVGQLIEALKEAQGLNEVCSRADAESFVRELFARKNFS